MTESWERLSLYESQDLLTEFYKKRHGGQLGAEKANEIIAHLSQGRGFFASAQQAPELTRPLILYYGVYALSRGLMLFLDAHLRELAIPPSHGLDAKDWNGVLAKGINQLPNLPIYINTRGTFYALSNATSNIGRCKIYKQRYSNSPHYLQSKAGTTMIRDPTTITIKMVLERLPDLSAIFATTFDSSPKYFEAVLFMFSEDTETDVSILETDLGLPDIASVRSSLGLPDDLALQLRKAMGPYEVKNISYRMHHSSKSELLAQLPPITSDSEGNTYLVELLSGGLNFSSLSLLFLTAYAMGMLARYYPSKWRLLLGSSKGDFAFPLMKAAIKLIEKRFPQLILQELEVIP